MAEKPILFSAPMVRAILAGTNRIQESEAMTTTPRTDEEQKTLIARHALDMEGGFISALEFARELERKLSKVTEQRDRLLAATKKFIDVQSLISGVFRLEEYVSHIKKLNALIREIEESKEP